MRPGETVEAWQERLKGYRADPRSVREPTKEQARAVAHDLAVMVNFLLQETKREGRPFPATEERYEELTEMNRWVFWDPREGQP